jgi:hypothetical protein
MALSVGGTLFRTMVEFGSRHLVAEAKMPMVPAMALTTAQLNRATLSRQMLLDRARVSVVDATRQIMALQAQEPMSPYIALWNRLETFDPADLDLAFASREVVKAPLMRITLHAVHAAEYAAFHTAMLPALRSARVNDRRFRETGLSPEAADALIPALVEFCDTIRSKHEILAHLEDSLGGSPPERLWWALRTYAPLLHAPTGGAWSFARSPSYVTPPNVQRPDPESALVHLVRRYLEAYGPATLADMAQFSMRRRSDLRRAAYSTTDIVELEGPGDEIYFDLPGRAIPTGEEPAPPRLMAMWDSTLLAYHDRSRIIPEKLRRTVIRQNGDVLPTILVDGYVRGVWRPAGDGIEARAFGPVSESVWEGLHREAADLVPTWEHRSHTYGRYDHWWTKLPEGETRILRG